MILEKSKNTNRVYDDDRSMRIFNKFEYRDKEKDIKGIIIGSDDTNMRIFSKSSWFWSKDDRSLALSK